MLNKVLVSFVLMFGIICFVSAQIKFENYQSHQTNGNLLSIKTANHIFTVQAYTDNIVRVGFYPDTTKVSNDSKVVVMPAGTNGNITDETNDLIYQTANTKVYIQKSPLKMTFIYKGDTLLREEYGFYFWNNKTYLNFKIANDEAFHGTGSRALNVNLRGQSLDMNNQAHYGYTKGEENLNIAIPFIISSKKYGVYFDHLNLGNIKLGQSGDTLAYQTNQQGLSYFFIASDSMSGILDNYTNLTGKAPLPPRWAFGYIQSKYGYKSETEARNIVTQMQTDNFPLDALVLDLYWFGGASKMGNLNWDLSQFQTPTSMISDFKNTGVKTILITEPYVTTGSNNYHAITTNKYVATDSLNNAYVLNSFWAGASVLLDLTDTASQNWMWNFYQNRISEGVAGWWCDLGEPEDHPSDMFHHGKPANEVHNYFSWEWSRMLQKKYLENYSDRRLFNLIRSGYAGMQRFGATPWSGDIQRSFAGMQAQIPIMLNMGYSGVGYSHSDLGGFTGSSQNNELYTRWLELGAFCPIMRAHGEGAPTEPVNYPDPYKSIVRSFIELRYKLLPYNYSLAFENALTGSPLVRSMDYYNPEIVAYRNVNDQYYWGENMLIAPELVMRATSRSVVLPAGNWVNYFTNQKYSGNDTISVSAAINTMPVFIKSGSLIPHTDLVMTTDNYKADNFSIWYYPDETKPASSYTMYNDDGFSPKSLLNNEYETIHFTANYHIDSTSIHVTHQGSYATMPISRKLEFRIKNIIQLPGIVTVDGVAVPVNLDTNNYTSILPSAYFDTTNAEVYVHTNWDNSNLDIVLKSLVLSTHQQMNKNGLKLNICPNVVQNQAIIEYQIPKSDTYRLELVDSRSVVVSTIFNKYITEGSYKIDWSNSHNLSSGVYYMRLIGKVGIISKPVIISK